MARVDPAAGVFVAAHANALLTHGATGTLPAPSMISFEALTVRDAGAFETGWRHAWSRMTQTVSPRSDTDSQKLREPPWRFAVDEAADAIRTGFRYPFHGRQSNPSKCCWWQVFCDFMTRRSIASICLILAFGSCDTRFMGIHVHLFSLKITMTAETECHPTRASHSKVRELFARHCAPYPQR